MGESESVHPTSQPSVTTPLVPLPSAPPLEAFEETKTHNLIAYVSAFLFCLFALIVSSFTSIYTLFSYIFLSFLHIFLFIHLVLMKLRPPTFVPRRFLVMQFILGMFLASLYIFAYALLAIVFAAGAVVISHLIILYFFAHSNPNAWQALTYDLGKVVRIPFILHAATPPAQQWSTTTTTTTTYGTGKIWGDMIAAGATPSSIIATLSALIFIFFLFYIFFCGIAITSATEYSKWLLFQRYKVSHVIHNVTQLPGKGYLAIALASAIGLSYTCSIIGLMLINHTTTFFTALLFIITACLDLYIIVASQTLVATAHAQQKLKQPQLQTIKMKTMFRKSIVYNFGLLLLRVTVPKQWENVHFGIVLIISSFLLLRLPIAWHYGRKFIATFNRLHQSEQLNNDNKHVANP